MQEREEKMKSNSMVGAGTLSPHGCAHPLRVYIEASSLCKRAGDSDPSQVSALTSWPGRPRRRINSALH